MSVTDTENTITRMNIRYCIQYVHHNLSYLRLTAMVGAEILGDDAALDADVEPGDFIVNDQAGKLFVECNPSHELLLRLSWLPVLDKKKVEG
jgi:hypothetical protein